MSIGGILAGALAGAGSAVQYNAQENIKKKREEALLKLEAKNRAAIVGAQNAQSMANSIRAADSREAIALMQEEGRNQRALLDASTYLEGEGGNAIMVQPKPDGGFEQIDTGIAYNQINKDALNSDIESARANIEMATNILDDQMLGEEERAFWGSFRNQETTKLQSLMSGGSSFPDQSEVGDEVNKALGATGGNGEQGGDAPPRRPGSSSGSEASGSGAPAEESVSVEEISIDSGTGLINAAQQGVRQRERAARLEKGRVEQKDASNFLREMGIVLNNQIDVALNQVGEGLKRGDDAQSIGDQVYPHIEEALRKDTFGRIDEKKKAQARQVLSYLIERGYKPPQGNQ